MNPRIDLFSPDPSGSEDAPVGVDAAMGNAVMGNVPSLVASMLGVSWALDRLKVVEDRRAADLETIEALSRALADRNKTIARQSKMMDLKEDHIARQDLTIGSLVAKDARSDADLAKHRQMDEYLREEVARLLVENARLRADLAKAGRDLDDLTRREAADKIRVEGHHPAGADNMISDPGPFGIDTPDYSDRDREMFVLGYEFAEASRDIRLVTAGDIPACRLESANRTIREANLPTLLKHAQAAGLDYQFRRMSNGWCNLYVRRRDA